MSSSSEISNSQKNEYNSVVTIILIIVLIGVRIAINDYEWQNIIIAWINFISMFYVFWRIHWRIYSSLKLRINNNLFKKQFNKYIHFSIAIFIILLFLMSAYTILIYFNEYFYSISGCINDILSLCALLFSIEDEKITQKITNCYKHK